MQNRYTRTKRSFNHSGENCEGEALVVGVRRFVIGGNGDEEESAGWGDSGIGGRTKVGVSGRRAADKSQGGEEFARRITRDGAGYNTDGMRLDRLPYAHSLWVMNV